MDRGLINVVIYAMVREHVCQCYGAGKCITLCSGPDNDEFGEMTVGEKTIGKKT